MVTYYLRIQTARREETIIYPVTLRSPHSKEMNASVTPQTHVDQVPSRNG